MSRNASVRLALAATLVSCARAPRPAEHRPRSRRRARRAPTRRRRRSSASPTSARWNRINGTALSPDGKWMTYVVLAERGRRHAVRQRPRRRQDLHDSRSARRRCSRTTRGYVGYFVSPPRAGRRARWTRRRRRGRPRRPRSVRADRRAGSSCSISRPATSIEVPDAATFKFSKGSKFVAVRDEQGECRRRSRTAPTSCCAS